MKKLIVLPDITIKEAFKILEGMEPYQALVVDYTSGKTKTGFFTAPLVET